MKTIRMVLALVMQLKLQVYQLDLKLTFLNGEIKEEVYMEQPQRYMIQREENKVYCLKKVLYGLKQALHAWNSKIDQYLLGHRFSRSPSKPYL